MPRTATGLLALAVLATMFHRTANAAESELARRRNPDVLQPVEAQTAIFRRRVDTHLFNRDFTKVFVLAVPQELREGDVAGGDYEIDLVPLNKVAERRIVRLVRQPYPIRMALIEGSFPYRRQVGEFQRKLGLSSVDAVLKEVIADAGVKRAAFRFLGVNVQRRTLDRYGKPLTDYQALDVDTVYKLWLQHSGQPCEPEDLDAANKIIRALVMPRLRLFRGGRIEPAYPPLARRLATLRKTTDAIQGRPSALPDHCLLRIIDATIEPNKTYQYRLQVRMANPNFGRNDVAEPEMARRRGLRSDWYDVPGTVIVPDEFIPYVVDQKDLNERDGRAYKGINGNVSLDRDRQVAFQLHRWVDSAPPEKDTGPVPIGEWAIADRVIVARGEYVSRIEKVDLPVWKYTLDSFFLPAEGQPKKTGFELYFGHNRTDESETILVDFEGGRQVYTDRERNLWIADSSSIKVLLLTHDGRLMSRNSVRDVNSKERHARRESWRERIEALKAR